MELHVEVEFLHGVFRGDPDGSASTGNLTHCEWPPAPTRLFSAFVAADGTGHRCAVTNGDELKWLEGLSAPTIRACAQVVSNPSQPRFVVEGSGKHVEGAVMEYVGKKAVEVRPIPKAAMRERKALYTYDVSGVGSDVVRRNIAALRHRAARIGYLGTSDSPVHVRILDKVPDDAPRLAYAPAPDGESGDLHLCTPTAGTLAALDNAYNHWRKYGPNVSRQHFSLLSRKAAYRHSGDKGDSPTQVGCVAAWLRVDPPVSGRRMRLLTHRFKQAVLSIHDKTLHLGEPDPLLHGHVSADRGYDLARYLPLLDVQGRHSNGRIHGLALWLPPGAPDALRAQAAASALAIQRLSHGGAFDVRVSSNMSPSDRPWAAHPSRWEKASRLWATATPAVHELRGEVDLSAVAEWCAHAGYPAPVHFMRSKSPFISGGLWLEPVEVHGADRTGHHYSHFIIQFDKPIFGPVAIGKGRQKGFGLCVPMDDG